MLWLACFDPVISPFPVKCVTENSHPAPGQSDTHEDSVWHCLSLSPELFAGPAQGNSVLKLIRTPLSFSLEGYMIHPKRSLPARSYRSTDTFDPTMQVHSLPYSSKSANL